MCVSGSPDLTLLPRTFRASVPRQHLHFRNQTRPRALAPFAAAALDWNPQTLETPEAWLRCSSAKPASGFSFRELLPPHPFTFFLNGEGEIEAEHTPLPRFHKRQLCSLDAFLNLQWLARPHVARELPSQVSAFPVCFSSPAEDCGDPSEQTSFLNVVPALCSLM